MNSDRKIPPSPLPETTSTDDVPEGPMTIGQIVEEWAGVFEEEYWEGIREEVRKRRERISPRPAKESH